MNKLPINFRLILCTHAGVAVDTFLFATVHRVWKVPTQVTAVANVWPSGSPQRYPHAAHRCAAYMHTSSTDSSTDLPGWMPGRNPSSHPGHACDSGHASQVANRPASAEATKGPRTARARRRSAPALHVIGGPRNVSQPPQAPAMLMVFYTAGTHAALASCRGPVIA